VTLVDYGTQTRERGELMARRELGVLHTFLPVSHRFRRQRTAFYSFYFAGGLTLLLTIGAADQIIGGESDKAIFAD